MSFFFYRQLSYDQQRAWLPSHRIWRSNATRKCVCGEAYRLRLRSDTRFLTSFATWEIEMVELSPKMRLNKEHFWRDRFYNYGIKSAAVTFKRSIAAGSIFGGIDSHAWRSETTRKHVSGFLSIFSSSREIYRFSQQQFLNANFAWNQDEVPQNSREAKKFFNIS